MLFIIVYDVSITYGLIDPWLILFGCNHDTADFIPKCCMGKKYRFVGLYSRIGKSLYRKWFLVFVLFNQIFFKKMHIWECKYVHDSSVHSTVHSSVHSTVFTICNQKKKRLWLQIVKIVKMRTLICSNLQHKYSLQILK